MQKYNIYKISSPNTKNIYIGSTKYDLITRLNQHKIASKYNRKNITSKIIIDAGSPEISLIENIECITKKDILIREGEHIKNNISLCVNKLIAGRTFRADYNEYKKAYKKKYDIINRERHQQYFKNYYKNNKRKI
jgi:hypothetical protein